jgi:histidyl-tRNA synthetase
MTQFVLLICKDSNNAKIIDLMLIYEIMSLLFYDELRLNVDNLDSIKRILIIIHIHMLYQTLFSCIQSIFVLFILRYVRKLLKFRSNDDSDRICKKLNDKKRLIVHDLSDDLSYCHEKLRIQL